jgi:hypothetical protein
MGKLKIAIMVHREVKAVMASVERINPIPDNWASLWAKQMVDRFRHDRKTLRTIYELTFLREIHLKVAVS